MNLNGVNAITLILIVSFAIERIVAGVMFLLSFTPSFPDPAGAENPAARARAEKSSQLIRGVLALFLVVAALSYYKNVRVLAAIGLPAGPLLDDVLTGIILFGGADRIGALLKAPGEVRSDRAAPQPIQVTGKLLLDDGKKAPEPHP